MLVHATSQDGLWSVIEAGDFPPGIGRSRTANTPGDALKQQWEPNLVTPPGPKSMTKFVMVRTMDLPQTRKMPSVDGFLPSKAGPKKFIPEYPHTCLICGGGMVILFSSTQHEGGVCPGPKAKTKARLR